MRISYAVAKVMAFIIIILVNTPCMAGYAITPILNTVGIVLAWLAIIFCVVRGLPVVWECKNILDK